MSVEVTRGTIKVTDLKENQKNPRVINNHQFSNLVKSLTGFTKMLELRPIVINEDNVILGGNMRLKALKHLGIEETPYVKVTGLTEEQETEFLIKNNLNYGDWDWHKMVDLFDVNDIGSWGLEIPAALFDDDEEPDFEVLDDVDKVVSQITLTYKDAEYRKFIDLATGLQNREDLNNFTEVVIFLLDR